MGAVCTPQPGLLFEVSTHVREISELRSVRSTVTEPEYAVKACFKKGDNPVILPLTIPLSLQKR